MKKKCALCCGPSIVCERARKNEKGGKKIGVTIVLLMKENEGEGEWLGYFPKMGHKIETPQN